MAVPKKRTSGSKSRLRRASWYARATKKYTQRCDALSTALSLMLRRRRAPQRAKAQGFGSSGR
jgi:hypothetical protein